ncbi:Rrf2 family transcriptional regulator [Streptomyces sp. A0642]|uniref:RrF2 family transcriptional regulator n=1 Tax=Streptomyces sp. A0642 TaxID=2563100 RepID=UPI001F116D5C|nr:Rrf2 family transcriptional regulator [Streptomyces sp. A0642]
MQALVRAGILSSTPGARGGFQLARLPERITLMDVVTAIEGPRRCLPLQRNPSTGRGSGRARRGVPTGLRRHHRHAPGRAGVAPRTRRPGTRESRDEALRSTTGGQSPAQGKLLADETGRGNAWPRPRGSPLSCLSGRALTSSRPRVVQNLPTMWIFRRGESRGHVTRRREWLSHPDFRRSACVHRPHDRSHPGSTG